MKLALPKKPSEWRHLIFVASLTMTVGMVARELPLAVTSHGRLSFGPTYVLVLLAVTMTLALCSSCMAEESPKLARFGVLVVMSVFLYLFRPTPWSGFPFRYFLREVVW